MEILIGLVVVAAAGGLVAWARRARRDEVFAGVTPGLLPAPGQQVERVPASERLPVAVRFEPPAGLPPGPAGVVVDGRFDPVELSATLIDLAIRGHLELRPVGVRAAADGPTPPSDWELHRLPPPEGAWLTVAEQAVLDAAFAEGPTTSLARLRARNGLAPAAGALQADVAQRGWFRAPGPAAWLRPLGWVAAVGGAFWVFSGWVLVGAGALAGGAVLLLGLRDRGLPLTAEGSAARTQALGFRQYLATAEADRLAFEVGIDEFSRYLPWAMVFGVVAHWREVFADALRAGLAEGDALPGMGWLVLDDALTGLLLLDLLDGGLFDGLAADFGSDGLDGGGDAGGDGLDGGGDGGDTGGDSGWGDFGGFDGGGFDFGGD